MAVPDVRATAARWRKALTDDEEKGGGVSNNVRLLLVCAGTLLVLLVSFIAVQANASAHVYHTSPATKHMMEDIYNSTLGFQKMYVVSLPERSDRRDSMSLAAAFTDLHIEYVDGVREVVEFAMPPGTENKDIRPPVVGAWRAHMNALRQVVELNLTSALILEDDVDWDLRIKSQMQSFARASQMLLQPLHGTTDKFLDPTHDGHFRQGPSNFYVDSDIKMAEPTTSPYADTDRWDVLWLGHCGSHWPDADGKVPLGRAVMLNDETVPEPQHIKMQMGGRIILVNDYPPHTRVVHSTKGNICSLAYAVSQRGARRILYELGIRRMDGSFDNMLRTICDGKSDRALATCLSVSPELFQHHRPVGPRNSHSDISGMGGYTHRAFTQNVRMSTRVNFPKLVEGDTDYEDMFKDGEPEDKTLNRR